MANVSFHTNAPVHSAASSIKVMNGNHYHPHLLDTKVVTSHPSSVVSGMLAVPVVNATSSSFPLATPTITIPASKIVKTINLGDVRYCLWLLYNDVCF